MIDTVIKTVKLALRFLEPVWFYTRSIAKKLAEDDILFLASGLAFNGILTLIPLTLLSVAALGTFLNSSELAMLQVKEIMNALFPPQPFATNIKESLLAFIADIIAYRASIGFFGVIVLVWTATSLFEGLRSVLHTVYRLKRSKSLLVSLAHHVGFVFLIFLLFLGSTFASYLLSFLEGLMANLPVLSSIDVPTLNRTIPTIVIVILTAFMFYIIYRHIPDTKPPKAAAIISTLTTTLLWVVSGQLFAIYLRDVSLIGKIYGSYAFILVLLIWVYYSSMVFVFGAMIGQVYWERLKLKKEGRLRRWV
ncbi:MAG: YihY/virulence factor BrkB family protein [Ignavibacteria bacterium]|nr:YihY/virulence factor BrkB family protein [Ignavibacteria bacterium]